MLNWGAWRRIFIQTSVDSRSISLRDSAIYVIYGLKQQSRLQTELKKVYHEFELH